MKEDSSARLLRDHDRRMRVAWPLAVLASGLAGILAAEWIDHPSWARRESWDGHAWWWLAGLVLTLLATACMWAARRRNLLRSARSLDVRLAAKNRIETATALQDDPGALAQAQREETAGFLLRVPVRQRRTLVPVLSAVVGLLVLAHLATLLTWTRPWVPRPAVFVQQPPPAELPKASIKWKSPEAETKAAPVEEVPLEAVAESASGLRDLALEISVNGGPEKSIPVEVEGLKAAGKHPVLASLYLDQLEVEPFDIVSYHLRARRIDPRTLPETVSAVQFVQVKPFRDDVREMPGGDGMSAFPLIVALKSAQLHLLKENFLLAHTDLPPTNEEWMKQNTRVGGEQGILEKKTGEVVQKLIEKGLPAEVVNLVMQAQPLMKTAGGKILEKENLAAQPPQGKALGLLTEVEKFFVKLAAKGGKSQGPKSVEDPFRDKKQFELKQRFQTAAGELELLTKEQERLAEDLSKPEGSPTPTPTASDAKPDPNKIDGSPNERQTRISQRIGALLNGRVFVPDVTGHLEQGRGHAQESLRQLDASDVPAAREPAASAARQLRLAVNAMNKAAADDAKDRLAEALRELNNAADAARSAPQQPSDEAARQKAEQAAKIADDTARKLAEAAQKQQETGSEKSAARMNDIAKSLSGTDMQKALDQLRQKPRDPAASQDAATRLQNLAGSTLKGDALTPDQIARLVEKLERAHANMQRLADNGPRPGSKGERGEGTGKPNGRQPGQDPDGNSPGKGESPSQGQGGTSDKGTGAGAGRREQFAKELLEDVRDGVEEATVVVPKSKEIVQLRETVWTGATRKNYSAILTLFTKIDPPLEAVIKQLRAELSDQQRQHLLKDQNAEQAPAKYREAVADYFEQLSRDYPAEPAPANPEKSK